MSSSYFYIRAASFAFLLFSTSIIINFLQTSGLILLFPMRKLYRNFMRFTQRLFGSLIIVLTYIFAPVNIVLTGPHHVDLKQATFGVIMVS
jgi:hypothetical protein